MEDAMENTIQLQPEKIPDHQSLYVASLILQEVRALIQCVHAIVAVLLQYEKIGTSIANGLMQFGSPAISEGY
jgi:hypothetical protein